MPPKPAGKSSPVLTRSSSSTSTNSTIDDVLRAIELMRKDQVKAKSENKLLMDALKHGLDSLTARLDILVVSLSTLSSQVSSLDTRVQALESISPPSRTPFSVSDVVSEFAERERCKLNILAHGFPESLAPDFTTKIAEDKATFSTIFSQLSPDLPVDFKAFRLGKNSSPTPRPVKITFNDHHTATQMLTSFRSFKKRSPDYLPGANLVRDKTRLEREQLRVCHQELARRNKEGELNLTISYQNGIPCVKSSRSKNLHHSLHHTPA